MCVSVSVIVPAYNMEKYLYRCADSVLRQTMGDFELIIVDDGSTDGTPAVCERLRERDERVRVIRQQNAGVGMARNAGLDQARGEFIQFVDADDAIVCTLLADATGAARESGADFVFFGVTDQHMEANGDYRDSGHFVYPLEGYYAREQAYANFCQFFVRPFSCAFRMYRRAYLDRLRLRFGTQPTEEDGLFNVAAYSGDFSGVYFLRGEYYLRFNRPGSAVNRYHSDRFSCQLNVNRAIERLAKLSGYGDTREGRIFIARQYIKGVNVAMRNEALPGSGKTVKQRKQELERWLALPEVAESLKIIDLGQFATASEKIKYWLIRRRWLTAALLMQDLYVRLRP